MKLYNLDRGDLFTIVGEEPNVYEFHHVDGMYSVCYIDKELIHLVAYAEVEKIKVDNGIDKN